jgi:hypothetical protein
LSLVDPHSAATSKGLAVKQKNQEKMTVSVQAQEAVLLQK